MARALLLLTVLVLPACVTSGELHGLQARLAELAGQGVLEGRWADHVGALASRVERTEATLEAVRRTAEDVAAGKVGLVEAGAALAVAVLGVWVARDRKYVHGAVGASPTGLAGLGPVLAALVAAAAQQPGPATAAPRSQPGAGLEGRPT